MYEVYCGEPFCNVHMSGDQPCPVEHCHCGKKTMRAEGMGVGHWNYSLWYDYCFDCASCRCDTSDGMLAGCPNGNVTKT